MEIDVDNHKLMYHPERVAEWLEKGDCYPIYVEIGPTNTCNHRCIFCALDFLESNRDYIDTSIMTKTLEDIAKHGVKSVMFAGEGEPLLHKDISLFTKIAKQSGMHVSITTNGVLFNQEKIEEMVPYLSWIRFSIDSGSPKNYSKIHGTKEKDFDKVIKNIEETAKFRNFNGLKTTIDAQFLLIPQNVSETTKLAKIVKEAGADNLQIKPYSQHPKSINRFVINYEDYDYLEPELESFNSDKFKIVFRKKTMQRLQEKPNYSKCHGLSFFALIDAKGNVIPCNLFYGNSNFYYGNLYEQKFSTIWEGTRRKEVLKELDKKGIKDCREGCRLDPINRYLYKLKNPHSHDNFI